MPAPAKTPSEDAHGLLEERAASEGLLLALLGQQAMRRLRAAHTEYRLSPRQFHLLGLLHDRGAMTQRELGAVMDVDPSILVTLLNPLEADGYLSRERDPTDRRRHVVTLTGAGERQLERAAQAQRDAEDELFAGLTEAQRAQLRRLLLVIRDQRAPLPTRQTRRERDESGDASRAAEDPRKCATLPTGCPKMTGPIDRWSGLRESAATPAACGDSPAG